LFPGLSIYSGSPFNTNANQTTQECTLVNINNVAMWVRSDGYSGNNPYSQNSNAIQWGITYPRGIPVGLVWVDGFIWGGFVKDGQEPELRVGGHNWASSGLAPGAILSKGVAENPTEPDVNRIWRYRPDWQTADLSDEAFDILASRPNASERQFRFTKEELQTVADSLRSAYEKDLNTWPWQKGAPFYDTNNNQTMDAGEEPGLLNAHQVVWFVANDLNPELTQALHGSPPIGIEMQVTLWAYKDDPDLENSIFRRVRVIYKGTNSTPMNANIDSMAMGIYSEVDIGNFGDDFAGTDTTLQMMFAYNSTSSDPAYQKFNLISPAVGYTLLQGPLIPSHDLNDIGIFNFKRLNGFRNLPMTGAWVDAAGDIDSHPSRGIYNGTLQYYNVLNGYRPRPESPVFPFFDPLTGKPTRFTRTGDPLTNTGWVDENPSNRQIDMTMANFAMALGDTQEVIFVTTAGLGADRLQSLKIMRFFARHARDFYTSGFSTAPTTPEPEEPTLPRFFQLHQNFPNPFNPSTEIRYELPAEFRVKLSVFNLLGQKVKTLVDETQTAGSHSAFWDGSNDRGDAAPSGLYFYKIELGRFSEIKKMLLVR
jgi:hypothetical protein